MKKIILILIILFTLCSCNNKDNTNNNEKIEVNKMEVNIVNITINNEVYQIELEDNETTKSFLNILPQELNMNELNGNEKYAYLDNTLPTDSYNPKHINKGDIMLFGNNCLVIFYKSFDTSYSYTKIGHINNLPDLDNNNILIKIEK